jgi:hypothetical protein
MKFCPTCRQPHHDVHDRVLHTGEGKVAVGLTANEIEDLLFSIPGPSLIVRMLRAMQLIDNDHACELAKSYEIALPPPK